MDNQIPKHILYKNDELLFSSKQIHPHELINNKKMEKDMIDPPNDKLQQNQQEIINDSFNHAIVSTIDVLIYILEFLSVQDLLQITSTNHELKDICEIQWKKQVTLKWSKLDMICHSWRRCYILRKHFQRFIVHKVSGKAYILPHTVGPHPNGRQIHENFSQMHDISLGRHIICSRERAAIYSRCQHMFELSLRIHRSIQEISNLTGIISIAAAQALIAEHTSLMSAVSSLRNSLLFESDLYESFPAPILLESNCLLRTTIPITKDVYTSSSHMMQLWISLNDQHYRPLYYPIPLEFTKQINYENEEEIIPSTFKFHELSGLDTHIDDNSIRYRYQSNQNELCINALISNTYLLYIFNPVNFNPLDWIYHTCITINTITYYLPMVKEKVFLHKDSSTLRIYFCYGKYPENDMEIKKTSLSTSITTNDYFNFSSSTIDTKPSPLYLSFHEGSTFSIHLQAKNVFTHATYTIMSCEDTIMRQRQWKNTSIGKREKHIPLANDSILCLGAYPETFIQYIECAIGFESLLRRLEITNPKL